MHTVSATVKKDGYKDWNGNAVLVITKAPLKNVSYDTIANNEYTGSAITPAVLLNYNELTLAENTDYSIAYVNNVKVGTATAVITAIGNNYSGTLNINFAITPKFLYGNEVTVSVPDQIFNGKQLRPAITSALWGDIEVPYQVSGYGPNVDAGENGTIFIEFTGNFRGSKTVYFNIAQLAVAADDIDCLPTDLDSFYTGEQITPVLTSVKYGDLNLTYSLTYGTNIEVATGGSITVTLTGNYSGSKTLYFAIRSQLIQSENIDVTLGNFDNTYCGAPILPSVTSTMYNGKALEYEVVYGTNTDVATGGSVTVNLIGDYIGIKTITFDINKLNVASNDITLSYNSFSNAYSGEQICPTFSAVKYGDINLTYDLSYGANLNVDDNAYVTVTLNGNCIGSKTVEFIITPRNLSADDITVNLGNYSNLYSGTAIKPPVSSVNYGEKDIPAYTYSYGENINVTTGGTVTVNLSGNYSGTKIFQFSILPKNINDIAGLPNLSIAVQIYTGNAIEPTVNVAGLTLNTDYDLEYTNNVDFGANTAKVIIGGINNYCGEYDIPFSIDVDLVSSFSNANAGVLAYYYNSLLYNNQGINRDYVASSKITYRELLLAYRSLTGEYSANLEDFSSLIGNVNPTDYATIAHTATVITYAGINFFDYRLCTYPLIASSTYNDLQTGSNSYLGFAKSVETYFYRSGNIYPSSAVTMQQLAFVLYRVNYAFGNYPYYTINRNNVSWTSNRIKTVPDANLLNTYRLVIDDAQFSRLYNIGWTAGTGMPLNSFGNALFYEMDITNYLKTVADYIKQFTEAEVSFTYSPSFTSYYNGILTIRAYLSVSSTATPITFEHLFGQDYYFEEYSLGYNDLLVPWYDGFFDYYYTDTNRFDNYYKNADKLDDCKFLMTAAGSNTCPSNMSNTAVFVEMKLSDIALAGA